MLKKIANKLVNRRGSELKVTFGGNIRNLMIKSRTKRRVDLFSRK